MRCVAEDGAAEYVYTARRNNSLSSTGRWLVFGCTLLVTLVIAVGFAVVFGAWPIVPFAGLEMLVLYVAFSYMDRHAVDYEQITICGATVAVEVREGNEVMRHEFNRHWAKLTCAADGSRLALFIHGREIELGRHLGVEARLQMARELKRELRSVQHPE